MKLRNLKQAEKKLGEECSFHASCKPRDCYFWQLLNWRLPAGAPCPTGVERREFIRVVEERQMGWVGESWSNILRILPIGKGKASF